MDKRKFAIFTLLMVTFIWGATFVVVQNAISFLEPHSFNFVRFFIAGIMLTSWQLIFQRGRAKLVNRKMVVSGIFLGFWLFIGYAFQTLGLLYTTSSKAGFITGLSVVLVPVISLFLLKMKPKPLAALGVGSATIGLYFLTMSGSNPLNIGDVLVFICAIGFAMHIIFTGKFTKQYPTLPLTIVQIFTVSFLSGIGAFLFEDVYRAETVRGIFQREVLFALILTGVFATALAFVAQTYFQKFTTPTQTALIFAMEPVFAALTALVWSGEILDSRGIMGSVLIVAGMILAELPGKQKKDTRNVIEEAG